MAWAFWGRESAWRQEYRLCSRGLDSAVVLQVGKGGAESEKVGVVRVDQTGFNFHGYEFASSFAVAARENHDAKALSPVDSAYAEEKLPSKASSA